MDGGRSGTLLVHKHEAAGNDFLVVVGPGGADAAGGTDLGAAVVRALCDRHRGLGADGLMVVGRDDTGADLTMVLRNADGGEAEMSGNGLRCLAQAAVEAGLAEPPRFSVATAAGRRTVDFTPGEAPGRARAVVEMGAVVLGAERRVDGRRAREVRVGNPHLVILCDDPDLVPVQVEGPLLEAEYPDGVNVEFVAPGPAPGELTLRVWERGVGETLACGTGSIAAAAAAREWGPDGDRFVVRNPGGPLEVVLGGPGEPALLGGPVRKVADMTVELAALL